MLWREGPSPAASSTNGCCGWGSVSGRDRPAEPGELARGGDRDDGAALVALLHPLPDVMQPPLRLPRQRQHLRFAVELAAREAARDPRRPPVVPGGLDQQPAGVLAAGLGDRPAPSALSGGMLGRDDAEMVLKPLSSPREGTG